MVVAADNMLSATATTSTSVVGGNDSSSPSPSASLSSPTSLARMIINIQSANTISLSFQID